jgi:hypothetical protein
VAYRATVSSKEGTFRLAGIPHGQWLIGVREPGGDLWSCDQFVVESDLAVSLDVTLSCTVKGTVNGISPANRGHLWVVAFDEFGVDQEIPVADDGTFGLGRLPLRRTYLKVGHDGGPDAGPHSDASLEDDPTSDAVVVDPLRGQTIEVLLDYPASVGRCTAAPTPLTFTPPVADDRPIGAHEQAVRRLLGVHATYRETTRVVDDRLWEGDVHVFDISGHESAPTAYSWYAPYASGDGDGFVALLHDDRADSPLNAVRVWIVQMLGLDS